MVTVWIYFRELRKKCKQQCYVNVSGRQPAPTCSDRVLLFKCLSFLEISLSCFFGWHLSMWAAKSIAPARVQDGSMILLHSAWCVVGD